MNNQDLAKIVKQVQKNKETNFEQLFSEIYRTIYYVSLKILSNDAEAEDVTQDIILYIYNHIEELKLPEGFNNWMNQIIYGKCHDKMRRLLNPKETQYANEYNKTAKESMNTNPEILVQVKEKEQLVLDIIQELPLKQKEVVLLYYYQQFTTPEIANILSCSLPSIQNRLFKAKKTIKKKMENSKRFHSYMALGIGPIPFITSILHKEAKKVTHNSRIQKRWAELSINRENLKTHIKLNKTNKVWFYIITLMTFGILVVTRAGLVAEQPNFLQENSQEYTILYNGGNEKQEQAMQTIKKVEELTIGNKVKMVEKETENTESDVAINTEKNTEIELDIEEGQWSVAVSDISEESIKHIWTSREQRVITNSAYLKDEELEKLKYEEKTIEETTGFTYNPDEYLKKSETVYHNVTMPDIVFWKAGSLETEKQISASEPITYFIHVENIGMVAGYNIIIKDTISQYIEFIGILGENEKNDANIENLYLEEKRTVVWKIAKLEPGEILTVAFQVKIKESKYLHNLEIHNTAYLKIAKGQGNLKTFLVDEEEYISSNNIVYILRQNNRKIPKTSDYTASILKLLILLCVSFTSILYTNKNIKNRRRMYENKSYDRLRNACNWLYL
jgi:RNA polymerase sigma factor, sigma-70 family